MFRKILIIEDIDSISLGITSLLEKKFTAEVHTSKYSDEGYLKIKKAFNEKNPFDLIITDLSFKEEPSREIQLASGDALIRRLKEENINPKIIVYSIEDKPYLVKSLFSAGAIIGFVVKGRESSTELIEAIKAAFQDQVYVSPQFAGILKQQPLFEIDKYDVEILKMLSLGSTQEDISNTFKQNDYPSPSTSSIEKKINKLKFMLKAQNSIHLIAIAKDLRIV